MLVILEGPDGVGKDTVAASLVSQLLEHHGLRAHVAAEPSKESVGKLFRDIVLCPDKSITSTPMLDTLLMLAARRENYERIIPELLSQYDVVIVTRNWMSLEAYQLWDVHHPISTLLYTINAKLLEDIDLGCPTVECLLYCEYDVACERMVDRGDMDRMEQRGDTFLQRVNATYAGFIGLSDVHVIDAKQSKEQVAVDVYETVIKELTRVQK